MRRKLIILSAILTSLTASVTADAATTLTAEQNAVLENIFTRTSVRSWDGRQVGIDVVEVLLRAAMAAPTARNRQPWHFVVLNNRDDIDLLAGDGHGAGMVRRAPLAIVVCGDMDIALEGGGRDFWIQDASAATENLLLAAHALGLGAVWTGVLPVQERVAAVKQALNLPDNLIPLSTVLIGYPAGNTEPKDKWNPEKITWGPFPTK